MAFDSVSFRHKKDGCSSVLVRYAGEAPLHETTEMRASDWRTADGGEFQRGDARVVRCFDCGETIVVSARNLVESTGPITQVVEEIA